MRLPKAGRGLAVVALLVGCAAAASSAQQSFPERPSGFAIEGPAEQGGLIRGSAPAGTVALALDGKPVVIAADGVVAGAMSR
jgi:hypothetical protein